MANLDDKLYYCLLKCFSIKILHAFLVSPTIATLLAYRTLPHFTAPTTSGGPAFTTLFLVVQYYKLFTY